MLRLGMYRISVRHVSGLGLACFATPLGMFCRLMGHSCGNAGHLFKRRSMSFFCMCALIKMKKAYKVSFLSSFFVLFLFGYVMHGFALLPFCSWFFGSAPGL